MAGESPDKSVDEGTPGAASTSAESDPRLSVFRQRDPEVVPAADASDDASADASADTAVDAEPDTDGSGGRDALRDAVAAWVATADEPPAAAAPAGEPADDEDGPVSRPAASERPTAFRPPAPAADTAPAAPEPAAAPAPDSASRQAEPAAAEHTPAPRATAAPGTGSASAQAGPTGDERTPASRAAGPAAEPGAGSASAEDRPAGDERTPASRAAGPAAEPGVGSASAGDRSVGDQRTTAFRAVKPAAAGEPADSERTAVFRAVKPSAADSASADKPVGDERTVKPAAAEQSQGAPAGEPVDSERTAVFRAVKPPAAGSASVQPKAASADEAGDSERTAVFRAVKPAAAEEPSVKEPAPRERTGVFRIPAADADDSERTATFRAVKPAAPTDRPADSASPASAAAAPPKASTFVPLRTDEPGQKPKPPAPAAPAAAPAAPAAPAPASMDRSERTTQQPLPPKPPLDMLADLTNNPPPPPSPLRTAVRRFKIYFPLVVLLAIILAVVQLVRPLPEPRLVMTAKSSYTFGGTKPELPWPSEGQAYMAAAGLGTLGQSGEQKPVPIASVTKSMTAYIILRDHPIKKGEQGAMIDVDKTAETEGKKNDSVNNESTLDTVKEGDKISEYDAIAALMIPSANNIARLLARWDAGSQEAFVKKMNDTAKELGMTNTTYTDPSGLDATTVSTAEDQVKLGLKLVEIETLLDITKKPKWIDPSGKEWRNWNGLVPYNDSLGIKTGTTTKAGGNLLFAAQKKIGNTNQLIVGAVLGQHKPPIIDSVLAASKQLMLATQKALEGAPVFKKGDVVGYVDDGLGGRTPVVATADVQAVGWASLTVNVKLADGGGKIPQTAKAGTEIGVLTVGEGASQVKVPVALQSELAAPGLGSKLTRVG